MNKVWMLVGLLLLAGCQKEVSPPVPPEPAKAVETQSTPAPAAAPVAQAENKAETAVAVPANKPASARPAAAAAGKTGVETVSVAPAAAAPAPVASVSPAGAESAPKTANAAGPVATDQEILALARKNNCFACHALDKKVVGPAWRAVAAKYRGDKAAQARLENKIAKGGSGVWGSVSMPPQPKLTVEQRAQLAGFILNLK